MAKTTLYLRINLEGHQKYVRPVYAGNGRLKPQFAYVHGQQQHYPDGTYTLRYRSNGKRVWEQVGSDPNAALVAKLKREKILEASALGLELKDEAGTRAAINANRVTLAGATEIY